MLTSVRSVATDRWAIGMLIVSVVVGAVWAVMWGWSLGRGDTVGAIFWGVPLALFILMGFGWAHAVRPRITVDEAGISGLGWPRHLRWPEIDKAFVWDGFLVVSPVRTGPYVWLSIRPKYPNNVYVRAIDPSLAEDLTEVIKRFRDG